MLREFDECSKALYAVRGDKFNRTEDAPGDEAPGRPARSGYLETITMAGRTTRPFRTHPF